MQKEAWSTGGGYQKYIDAHYKTIVLLQSPAWARAPPPVRSSSTSSSSSSNSSSGSSRSPEW